LGFYDDLSWDLMGYNEATVLDLGVSGHGVCPQQNSNLHTMENDD
jgi:hypothetical protein